MTGIDRLRGYARRMDELHVWPGGAKLLDIAGQIEREHDAEVADSPYDAILPEDREAAAWVRGHGGLDHVKSEWRSRVPYDRYERRRQSLLGHIAECERALGRRRDAIARIASENDALRLESAQMRLRLMPEGMEWPRYTSGELVEVGDDVVGPDYGERIHVDSVKFHANGFTLCDKNGFDTWYESDERFERPTPKVLDVDGVEIRAGDRVWTKAGTGMVVTLVESDRRVVMDGARGGRFVYPADRLTHRAPVIAADGRPLCEGETVWDVPGKRQFTVLEIGPDTMLGGYNVNTVGVDGMGLKGWSKPSDLTHERPDSWERLEEDAEKDPCDYFGFDGEETCGKCPASGKNCEQTMARDLVRRARALAERERGER